MFPKQNSFKYRKSKRADRVPELVLRRRILAGLRRAQGLEAGFLAGLLGFDDGLRKGLPINLPKLLTLPTFVLSLLPVFASFRQIITYDMNSCVYTCMCAHAERWQKWRDNQMHTWWSWVWVTSHWWRLGGDWYLSADRAWVWCYALLFSSNAVVDHTEIEGGSLK